MTRRKRPSARLGEHQTRTYVADVRRDGPDNATTVTIGTDAVDGHGTIVDPEGMRLSYGNRSFSGRFFVNHDMNLLAGFSPDPVRRGSSIVVRVPDENWDLEDEKIARWYRKVKGGLLDRASIGFVPIDGDYEEMDGRRVYRYTEWMLQEWSFTPISSNPEAEVTARATAPPSGPTRYVRVEDAKRLLEEQRRKRRAKARIIAERILDRR